MIHVTESDRVREIVVDRPPLNILSIDLLNELDGVLQQPTEARVVLLRGKGRCFSAGADVKEHLPDQVDKVLTVLHRVVVDLVESPIPTVAVVHGSVMGAGLELVLACDLAYAAEGATLQQPEIRLGCIAPVAAALLTERIGRTRAMEMLLTGRAVHSEEAAAIGLVTAVLPAANFIDVARERARGIAAYSRAALGACRRAARSPAWTRALQAAEKIYLDELVRAEDYSEGLNAFLEKRAPVWKDR
jgi:cyclohexa-1,5-dienecarbonyl-CoA hydratase